MHDQVVEFATTKVAAGAGPDAVRVSIGFETAEDLIADLDRALHAGPS